jgi:hypothetical protein
MTIETEVANLAQQTTDLLDACLAQVTVVQTSIDDAVALSENAAQIPLVNMAANLIDTQTLVVQLIARES